MVVRASSFQSAQQHLGRSRHLAHWASLASAACKALFREELNDRPSSLACHGVCEMGVSRAPLSLESANSRCSTASSFSKMHS